VVDPQELFTSSPSSAALAYDPYVDISAKYNGSLDESTIGRFLAVPGLITDETITAQLSVSLAALRPAVAGFIGDSTLVFQPQTSEDIVFTSDTFDPGTLQGSDIPLKVKAFASDGQNLSEADNTRMFSPFPAGSVR
jgi:hypothetical protein